MQGKPYLHPQVAVSAPPAIDRKSDRSQAARRALDKGMNTIALALLFLWIVIAVPAKVGWGMGLLGTGLILIGINGGRKYFGLQWAGFWVVLGIFSILFGIGLIFHLPTELLPLLGLFAAAGLLLSLMASRLPDKTRRPD